MLGTDLNVNESPPGCPCSKNEAGVTHVVAKNFEISKIKSKILDYFDVLILTGSSLISGKIMYCNDTPFVLPFIKLCLSTPNFQTCNVMRHASGRLPNLVAYPFTVDTACLHLRRCSLHCNHHLKHAYQLEMMAYFV